MTNKHHQKVNTFVGGGFLAPLLATFGIGVLYTATWVVEKLNLANRWFPR